VKGVVGRVDNYAENYVRRGEFIIVVVRCPVHRNVIIMFRV